MTLLKYLLQVKSCLKQKGSSVSLDKEDMNFVRFSATEPEITPAICADAIIDYRSHPHIKGLAEEVAFEIAELGRNNKDPHLAGRAGSESEMARQGGIVDERYSQKK